jgi:type I restriction enzyme R subunit
LHAEVSGARHAERDGYNARVTEPFSLHLFDRESEVAIIERRLPHWAQAGAITFITWRTDDSIPAPVLAQWRADRCRWLRTHGIDPNQPNWQTQLAAIELALQREFRHEFSQRWHNELDAGHGACVLCKPELAQIVADSLKHFDGDRYVLTDFVVMPNHVHLLAAFRDEAAMLAQCESWKHYTAVKINRLLGRTGRLWEQDAFDHLVRTQEQFDWLRRYIAENPVKAGLLVGQFLHYSKPL